jgi:DNA-binding CsgD family transcriptional regulator
MTSKTGETRLSTKALAANEREWSALSELIGRVYECALDPTLWDDTLVHMAALLGPAEWDVVMLLWERQDPPSGRFVGAANLIPMAREVYLSTFAARQPWSRRISNLQLGRVIDTDEIMPRSEIVESSFYKNYLATWNLQLAVAVMLDRNGPQRLGLIMPGPPGPALDGLKRGLRLLAPHLQRAVRIGRALGQANLRAGAAETALEQAPVAVVTLTPDLRLMTANAKATTLIESGWIRIADTRFAFADRKGQARLAALAALPPPESAAFKIAGPNDAELAVLAARIPTQTARTLAGEIEGAGIVVSIGLGGRAPLIEIDRLAAWFGLTPSEARLAAALAGGDNLQDYADRRSISTNAVRFLLKGVYRKTGAESQGQLVAKIRDLPLN